MVRRQYIGVGVSSYLAPCYPALGRAVKDVAAVGDELGRRGFSVDYLLDPGDSAVRPQLRRLLAAATGPVIVYWAGHGIRKGQSDLRLVLTDTGPCATESETCSPIQILDDALAGAATQILLVLDTCFAGTAAGAVVDFAAQFASTHSRAGDDLRWVGVIAATQSYEEAIGGRLAGALVQLLRDGPSARHHRAHWSAHNEGVRGVDLAAAVRDAWQHESQQPWFGSFGWSRPMLPNPRYDPNAHERTIEHLLLAARGTAPGEDGWFFSGRRHTLRQVVDWLDGDQPGVLVVTGAPGTGKSAILGRLVALSDPVWRRDLVEHGSLAPDDPELGENSIDACVYLRGRDHEASLAALADALGVAPVTSVYGVLEHLARQARRPVVVLDGLDEAQAADRDRLLHELLLPLARHLRVIVAIRTDQADELRRHAALVCDLADEPDTPADIAGYVAARLAGSGNGAVGDIAPAVAARAVGTGGGFLYARIVTSQLLAEPVDTASPGWEDRLSSSVVAAFTRDVVDAPAVGLIPSLAALAWSFGQGLPIRDLWPALATAMASGATTYTERDVELLLSHIGRYVIESGEGGQAVYRLFHQELVDHLTADGEAGARLDRAVARLLVEESDGGRWPEAANPYLRRHAAAHLARLGTDGIATLASLAEVSPAAYDPELAKAWHNHAVHCHEAGRDEEAVAAAHEAVALYRVLAAADGGARLADLAHSLTVLSLLLVRVGRRTDALAAAEEAVRLRRTYQLDDEPALPDLADSLTGLALSLSEAGRQAEAAEFAQEATALWRRADQTASVPPRAGTALSLANLASVLLDLDRNVEARAAAEEAVTLAREAALADRYDGRLALAAALNNLANCLIAANRPDDAVAAATEATAVSRRLTELSPDRDRPLLALALVTLAKSRHAAGMPEEAVPAAEQAVAIRRHLAAGNLTGQRHHLSRALSVLGQVLVASGQHDRALPVIEDAAAHLRLLADDGEHAFDAELTVSLRDRANLLADLGRTAEVLDLDRQRVATLRRLVSGDPTTYLPRLADAVTNLADSLAKAGRNAEALQPGQEAVRLYAALGDQEPAYHGPLVLSLYNLGSYLSAEGRLTDALHYASWALHVSQRSEHAEEAGFAPIRAMAQAALAAVLTALGATKPAIDLGQAALAAYRKLAAAEPAHYLDDVASSLSTLAQALAKAGRLDEALDTAQQAVTARRQLAAAGSAVGDPARCSPDSHRPALAQALTNLAHRRVAADQAKEAVPPAEEAVEIYTALPGHARRRHLPQLGSAVLTLSAALSGAIADEMFEDDTFSDVVGGFDAPEDRAYLLTRRCADHTHLPLGTRLAAGTAAVELLSARPAPDPPGTVAARAALRILREDHGAEFDALWRERFDDLPSWLTIDRSLGTAVAAWANTTTWAAANQQATRHPELFSDAAGIVLAELRLKHPDNDRLRRLHEVYDQVRAGDLGGTFAPLLARETVETWLAQPDWPASQLFLHQHSDELLSEGCRTTLAGLIKERGAEPAVIAHAALLDLARSGRPGLGYAYLAQPSPARRSALIARRLASATPPVLAALAELALVQADDADADGPHWQDATLLAAVAATLAGQPDQARRHIRQLRTRVATAQVLTWTGRIARLVPAHPDRAEALLALLDTITHLSSTSTRDPHE